MNQLFCWPKLKHLSLNGCSALSDAAVLAVADHCLTPTVLNLQHCLLLSEQAITHLLNQCLRLEQLYLKGCRNITDAIPLRLARLKIRNNLLLTYSTIPK